MLQLADDKKVLKQLEDKILKLLSESSGALLVSMAALAEAISWMTRQSFIS